MSGLLPVTEYTFCIRAFDEMGFDSGWSNIASATTHAPPDLTPPLSVQTSRAEAISSTEITLYWPHVDDAIDPNSGLKGNVIGYDIRKSLNPIYGPDDGMAGDICDDTLLEVPFGIPPDQLPAIGGEIAFLVNTLSEDLEYFFCIRARDDSGNKGTWSLAGGDSLSARTWKVNRAPKVALSDFTIDITNPGGVIINASAGQGNSIEDEDAGVCNVTDTSLYAYAWRIERKPTGSGLTDADLGGATTTQMNFTPDVTGRYTFLLDFTDAPGTCGAATGRDSLTVMVIDELPSPDAMVMDSALSMISRPATSVVAFRNMSGNYALRLGADCSSGTVLDSGLMWGMFVITTLKASDLNLGKNTVIFCITKSNGTTGGSDPLTVILDNTAPIANSTPLGLASSTPVTVNLSCSDNADSYNIGCDRVLYTLDGTSPGYDSPVYKTPITMPDSAVTTLKFRSVDKAGNWGAENTEVYRIDSLVPNVIVHNDDNQYVREYGLGHSDQYSITWRTDRSGLSYQVLIGAED
ncbi:MAG: hypothetical protein DRI30_08230, partial [Chloroflexi bacterium]